MLRLFPIYIIFLFTFFSCASSIIPTLGDEYQSIYREFWNYVDAHYIYFNEKNVDWNSVFDNHYPTLENGTEEALKGAIEASLLTLKDNHNRFEADGYEAKTYSFTDSFDIHFDRALVEKNYIKNSFLRNGNLYYAYINDTIGYIHLSNFTRYGGMQDILREMHHNNIHKLIFDMRNNGGGDSNPIPDLIAHFVKTETILGGYVEKNGPAHDDKTSPILVRANPSSTFIFDIPIVVLINRACYSATSYFAAMMKGLPNVTLMGQITGGGGGGNYGYQLSNGWMIAISVSDFVDKDGLSIEPGVSPDITVVNSAAELEAGIDRMLEMAIAK